MQVKISKLSGGVDMRTSTIIGKMLVGGAKNKQKDRMPEVGEYPVIINGCPLDKTKGNARMFNTSPIKSYTDIESGRQITTESGSVYLIELP
jgi:hypothetical protein